MSKYDYSRLQNGSDIRGVAIDGVAGEEVNLDAEAAERIAKRLSLLSGDPYGQTRLGADHLCRTGSPAFGPALAESFFRALAPYGCRILDAGLCSTPAMFMSTLFKEYRCDGAVMITASHLPFNRNGFKFFDRAGGLNKGDITDILTFAESDSILNSLRPSAKKEPEAISLLDTYASYLRGLITNGVDNGDNPLSGMKITVDAGNGSGGFFAEKVLSPLGADVSSSQFLDPDGRFPNHAPNPEDKSAMASICQRVKESSSDLGLIFDTDVDRSSAVDENGKEISRNGIVAMAAALIADEYPKTTVVTDSITSRQLTEFLEDDLHLSHLRFSEAIKT